MQPEFSQNKKIFDKSKSLRTFETPIQMTISSVDKANSEGNLFHLRYSWSLRLGESCLNKF